ncbi:MAG TPA: YbhB/YbcL family Raf kinase inhibitor-like protein [archaeon]|nr:YbhB/YbcL family Raf kinase inhibitor-like protein [archaeon]
MPLELTSPDFEDKGKIPPKYTCDGQNTNPSLKISDVPVGAKGLVLIVDDPDAVKPAGKVWDHWVLWNIDPKTTEIKGNSVPSGAIQGKNGSGKNQYQGPCPPDAEHRYFFKLYVLDTQLNLPEGSTKADVERAMEGHVLENAELIGKYERV